MSSDQEYFDAVLRFVEMFELVFDNDWDMTQGIIKDPKYFIEEKGTFINPKVEDEYNNWGNRGGLLEGYRNLKSMMLERGQKTILDEPPI